MAPLHRDPAGRGVFPTAAGVAFLERAARALEEMRGALVDAGRAARGETGRLRIGFISSALLDPLPGVLGRFRRDRPDVRLDLVETGSADGVTALVDGRLDVAVGRGAPRGTGAEGLVTVPIGTDDLFAVVAVRHPFAGRPSVSVDQLVSADLIVSPEDREPAVRAWLRTLVGAGALDRATTARDLHTIVGLAACGTGVGLGPTRMRRIERADVRFSEVTPAHRLPDLRLSFRAADRSPVLAAFLDVVRANCDEVGARLDEVLAHHRSVDRSPG